jgi:hypothetical protein
MKTKRTAILILLFVSILTTAGVGFAIPRNESVQPAPTITIEPTTQVNLWYIFQVEVAYRGYLYGALRTLTVRDQPNINGKNIAALTPYSKWWCDIALPETDRDGYDNIWCRLSAQDAYIPLKYRNIYYTDWRE